MPTAGLFNVHGELLGEIELNGYVFGIKPNQEVMHQAVVMHMASQRRGSAATKTRGMVKGGGRKPWRQKGTGRARAGSTRSPLWRSGGITFGPHPRSYAFQLPKKMRRLALRSALSDKVANGDFIVLDDLFMALPKTRELAGILSSLGVLGKALVVTGMDNENVFKSSRNIPSIKFSTATGLNVYDVLNNDKMVITRDAVSRVEEALS